MQQTLMMIKPDAVSDNRIGEILRRVEEEGFKVRALKMASWDRVQAAEFYAVHIGKPFYEGLMDFIISGPVVPVVLEREDAVDHLRAFIGSTDSREAARGTIRSDFGRDNRQNAVHASDSPENAAREIAFFFGESRP